MNYIGKNTGKPVEFPAEYPLFEIGHKLLIKEDEDDTGTFYEIKNRGKVINIEKKNDSNWLISADSEQNIGNIDDFLKASKNTFYTLTMGIYSDRNIDLEIRIPNSTRLYGIKENPDAYVSPDISPLPTPSVVFYSFDEDDTYIPYFTINNNTEYTPRHLKIRFHGHKYNVEKIDKKPPNYHTIVLSQVEGGA